MSATTIETARTPMARPARPLSGFVVAGQPTVSTNPVPAALHLTARGRRAISLGAILLVGGLGLLGTRAAAGGPAVGEVVDTYTVGAGETLWSIATSHATAGDDVRDIVAEIASLNELPDSRLEAGQQLVVPVANS